MAYVKTVWVDDATPLSAENMNKIENGVYFAPQFKSGSASFPAGQRSYTVVDADVNANSLVVISPTAIKMGVWIVDSANGSYTITSDATESVAVSYDYYIITKAVS